jgi:hypothetical protein
VNAQKLHLLPLFLELAAVKFLENGEIDDSKVKVFVLSHTFDGDGAPRLLLSVNALLAKRGFQLYVISPCDGELNESWKAIGATVKIVPELSFLGEGAATSNLLYESFPGIIPNIIIANTGR